MGSRFSRKKDGSRPPKSKKKEPKTPNGMNNPHMAGSSLSLDIQHYEVSSSLNPADPNAYSQPEDGQTLRAYHSVDDLSGRARPVFQSPPKPPPSRPHNQEHHIMQTQPHIHSLFESHPDQVNPIVPPRGKLPAVPNRESNNREVNRRKDAPEDEGLYLEEKKGNAVYHQVETKQKNPDNFYYSPESKSRPKLRADRNYESNHENDISFRKGDNLQLLRDEAEDGWYYVKNLTTGAEGYAHKDWVSVATSHDVESQGCFFVELSREGAEERLLEPYVELGTYLLRPGADGYALSLRCETELYELEIRHYKVRVAEKGICYIETDSNRKPFSNITELIRYYSEKPGLRCKLKKPLPQDVILNDLAVKFSDLKLGERLGSGNFATVNAGTLCNNKQVAVKSLKAGGSMTVKEFQKEAETMHELRDQNLVSLLGICEDRGTIYIITERMSRGSLQALLRKDSGSSIKFEDLMHMAIQVVEGMCYLEMKGFVHRDLRAANVLVGDENITKIADFGLTRLLDNYFQHEDFYQITKGSAFPYKWTAPESIKQQKFTVKSDVWSFGILLYEMVTYGDEPYAAMSNQEVLEWVEKGNRLKKPADQHNCPMTLYNIMKQCWLINSSERPNFADIREALVEIKAL